jgi:uncharacterized protein HemX
MSTDLERRKARAELLARTAVVLVIAATLVVLAGLVVIVAQNRDITDAMRAQQERNASTLRQTKRSAEQARRTARVIRDCTTPGGECYARGQAQTGQAISDLQSIIVAANACTAGAQPPDVPHIKKCVVQALAASREGPVKP